MYVATFSSEFNVQTSGDRLGNVSPSSLSQKTRGFDARISKQHSKKLDNFSINALSLAKEIIAVIPAADLKTNTGIFIANTYAGWEFGENQLINLVERGAKLVSPFMATAWFPAAAQGEISIKYDIRGTSKTFSGGNFALSEAMLAAFSSLTLKKINYAIVLVSEACDSNFLLSSETCDKHPKLKPEFSFGILIAKDELPGHARANCDFSIINIESSSHENLAPLDLIEKLSKLSGKLREFAAGQRTEVLMPLSASHSLRIS